MLVIVSDLHLTDGTTGRTITEQAFRVFRQRLSDAAYDASWRKEEKGRLKDYRPIERMDVILLGDILDVIRSTKWLDDDTADKKNVRPWSWRDRGDSPVPGQVRKRFMEISAAILKENEQCLAILRQVSEKGVTIPMATEGDDPRPVDDALKSDKLQAVKVRFHYMIGNHDAVYHFPGDEFIPMRQKVVTKMGLSNAPEDPFPYCLEESQTLQTLCREHQVYVHHGHYHDKSNFTKGDPDGSCLGDAIVIDVITRFPKRVEEKLGDLESQQLKACEEGLREIDSVRPLTHIPDWVDGLLKRTYPGRENRHIRTRINKVWDNLVKDFAKIPFVKQHDGPGLFGIVDWFKYSSKFRISWLARLVRTVRKLTPWRPGPSITNKKAIKDIDQAQFVVYGHTHGQRVVPLDTEEHNGSRHSHIYLNAGTWRPVHRMAIRNPRERDFVTTDVMTYLVFYKDDERGRRQYESWSCALDSPAGVDTEP